MPATAMRAVQIGSQSGFSTAVAAKVRLAAVTDAELSIVDEVLQPETLGVLSPMTSPAQVAQHGEGSITQQASYQDLVYLASGVFGTATASAAANTTYVWKFAAGVSDVNDPLVYTVEYGGTSAEYQATGAIMNALKITGEVGGLWEASVELLAKSIQAESMTTGLTVRPVDMIRMADTKLYVDTWTGTMGMTEVKATLISFTLSASPNYHLKQFAGSLTPQSYGMGRWDGELTTTLEFNSTSKAYVDALLSGLVQRQLQLKATTGSGTTAREATIQFAGTLVDGATLFGDRDGNMVVELTWRGTYHGTLDTFLKIRARNEKGTL